MSRRVSCAIAACLTVFTISVFSGNASAQTPITTAQASRFLEQCTFGPTTADIQHVKDIGYSAYLDEQFAAPASNYNYTIQTQFSLSGAKLRFLQNALRKPDQLRQRIEFALSQILVASGGDNVFPGEQKLAAMVGYQNVLRRNAFGNYRTLLYEMTLDPAMGAYLNMVNNAKGNAAMNSQPNENYGRELLQLFSLGVYMLNDNGTVQKDSGGNPIPTYGNDEVTAFARVFTGWTYAPRPNVPLNGFQYNMNFTLPMALYAPNHDTGAKKLLRGTNLPAITNGQSASTYATDELNAAIDNIFQHPNLGPFVCTRLINHLVTANPTPEYVARVVAVFNGGNGGTRGDLKATVRAILLDSDARTPLNTFGYGHWRSGILYMTSILRQLDAQGDLGGLEGWALNLRQDIMSPPSVFSFYKPDTTTLGLPDGLSYIAPETQGFTTESAIRRINFANQVLFTGTVSSGTSRYTGVTGVDITPFFNVAMDTTGLIDLVSDRFLQGRMTTGLRTEIANAVNAIPTTASTPALVTANQTKRARTALYLAICSQEHQVVR